MSFVGPGLQREKCMRVSGSGHGVRAPPSEDRTTGAPSVGRGRDGQRRAAAGRRLLDRLTEHKVV